uniref:Protein kinase domain-containing protein n=1 Tax=Acrobeloides nanus TaxID=290746 RepID=A0A914DZK8_9BILA
MAPEIQTNGGSLSEVTGDLNGYFEYVGYGRAVDIWSTGCVVLEMLTGKKPYHYLNHEQHQEHYIVFYKF